MNKRIWRLWLVFFVIGIATTMVSTSFVRAEENEEETLAERMAKWYQREFFTAPGGGYGQTWSFGSDIGWGQTGTGYQYVNPQSGQMVFYQSTGIGPGLINAPVWGGFESPWGQQSYGPFWGGNIPGVQSTPFGWSQGFQQGSIWGQTQAYQYQPLFSMSNLFGGGLGGGGLSNWGNWGNLGSFFPGNYGYTGSLTGSYPSSYPQRIY